MIISCHGDRLSRMEDFVICPKLCYGALKYPPTAPHSGAPSRIGCWGGGMFGPKREEITEDGRRLNNEGPRDVC